MIIETLDNDNDFEAFSNGAASFLISKRNKNLGVLFTSERAVYYIQILYRMLCFRREHEIEPLNDEIYHAVKSAQESVDKSDYSTDNFNHDMQQLINWRIINNRIEKERLRGYKDIRRQKFRYRLTDEVVSFLEWLEDRLNGDIEDKTEDTRNLLLDVTGRLKETSRELSKISEDSSGDNDSDLRTARTVVYNITCLSNLTLNISRQLSDLNAKLLMFLIKNYNIDEAKKTIRDLEFYSGAYLMQIYRLRNEIVDNLDSIITSNQNINKLSTCHKIMEEEYAHLPSMVNVSRNSKLPSVTFNNIFIFYSNNGKLDQLCERINKSAMRVWGKLSSHLRELERSNSRLEDITARLIEFSKLKEDETAPQFFIDLMCPAYMKYDPNHWDDHELADPPMLKRYKKHYTKIPGKYVSGKRSGLNETFVSMEQSKLDSLLNWIEEKLPVSNSEDIISISDGEFTEMEDFNKIIELIKAGYLGNGKKLKKINYILTDGEGVSSINIGNRVLEFKQQYLRNISREF